MAFEGWASYGGVELVNNARAAAYSAIPVRCAPGDLAAALGDEPYTSPKQDDAPWYDAGEPASAEFWGLAGIGVTGADAATAERAWTELLGDGAVPGAERKASREVEIKALALAADEQALNYGLAWLAAALAGSACGDTCTGDELCLFTAAPQPPSARPGGCGPGTDTEPDPPPEYPVIGAMGLDEDSGWDAYTAGDELLRTLFDVARVEGPRVESRRRLAGGVVAEVAFTLRGGVPHWYRVPRPVARLTLADLPGQVYSDTIPAYNPIGVLEHCGQDEVVVGDCLAESPYRSVPAYPAEPVLSFPDPSYPTTTFTAARLVFTIPSGTNPGWLEKVPVLRVHSGSLPLHRFTVRWYDNPLDRLCSGAELDPCEACSEITLPFLPRASTLTIDSRTRRAVIECPGSGAQAAEYSLYGPRGEGFEWPVFECSAGMCVEIIANADGLARDVTVGVDMVTREDMA